MAKPLSTDGLAEASARRPWVVVGIWIALLVAAGIISATVSLSTTTELALLNKPESERAYDLLEERLRGPRPATETVIVRSETATVDDPAFQAAVVRVTNDLLAKPELVKAV